MAKRFICTDMFKKQFIRSLDAPYKLLWIYILSDCNHAGIWEVDFEVCEIRLGVKLKEDVALKVFIEKIIPLDNGLKWFIPDFVLFQYGELKETNMATKSVITVLKKYNLIDENLTIKPLQSPFKGAMDMVKDKDMVKDAIVLKPEKEEIILPWESDIFINYWNSWKEFKKVHHKFNYKTAISEQMALKDLSKLSGGIEELALKIIEQSIAKGWKGFFELKESPQKEARVDLFMAQNKQMEHFNNQHYGKE